MKREASKAGRWRWTWLSRTGLGLLAVVLLLALLPGSAVASFSPSAEIELSSYDSDDNADITSIFSVPVGDVNFDAVVTFTPSQCEGGLAGFFVASDADVPDGTEVGQLHSDATLGLTFGACVIAMGVDFTLLDASTDVDDYFENEGKIDDGSWNGFDSVCPGGHDRAVCEYPGFLLELFPDLEPRTRYYGKTWIAGGFDQWVVLSFLVFEPGQCPSGYQCPAAWGYPSVTVLNDPTTPATPASALGDFCTPMLSENTVFGLADGNPVRTNPPYESECIFRSWSRGLPDADGDGFENDFDTCPFCANTDTDPRVDAGPDVDAIDACCDPQPGNLNLDYDGDDYANNADNCPLVANGEDEDNQEDADADGIGDACDTEGNGPNVIDGARPDETIEMPVDISGPAPPVPGEDTDADGFDDTTEAALGSCYTDDLDGDDCEAQGFGKDVLAEDSTPEHTSIAGTCTDEEDNDLDGYIDYVDAGCGDDTDGDGASDEGEEDLGSDPEDANSTPEHASVAGSCTDGVDNDGDGDTDAADEDCAVEEVTPTVGPADTDGDTVSDEDEELYGSDPEDAETTPESLDFDPDTCSDGLDNDGDGLTDDDDPGCAVEEATPTPTVQAEYCSPVFPGLYNGLVRIDGQPAASGYEVTASIGGVQRSSALVSGGRYAMDIPDPMPSEPPCFEGGTITFALDAMECTPTADWASGIQTVDLSCAPAAPPVTPTPEVTPTPTITPTTVPPTGAGGLSGSGPGLPLWAMALASWAGLTIVAGLGTLVAAKRR